MNPDEVIYRGKYIWHKHKNTLNKKEHKISFEEAVDVFDDPFSVEEYDIKNSVNEDRYNITGIVRGRMIVITVTMTLRGELIRIISAREAEPDEVEVYGENVRISQTK
jgi:uncharacterized DUF497 family protein